MAVLLVVVAMLSVLPSLGREGFAASFTGIAAPDVTALQPLTDNRTPTKEGGYDRGVTSALDRLAVVEQAVSNVSEPAALLLLGTGIGLLTAKVNRRRKVRRWRR